MAIFPVHFVIIFIMLFYVLFSFCPQNIWLHCRLLSTFKVYIYMDWKHVKYTYIYICSKAEGFMGGSWFWYAIEVRKIFYGFFVAVQSASDSNVWICVCMLNIINKVDTRLFILVYTRFLNDFFSIRDGGTSSMRLRKKCLKRSIFILVSQFYEWLNM